MKGVKIKKAGTRDFESLKQMKQEFFQQMARIDSNINKGWFRRGLPSQLGISLRKKDCAFFIAYHDNSPAGYCGVKKEKNPASMKHRKKAHVFNLYTRKGFRRSGIGSMLLDRAVEWASKRNLKQTYLMVHSCNNEARKLYMGKRFADKLMLMERMLQ